MPAPTIPVFNDLARRFDALINMTAPSWRDVGAVALNLPHPKRDANTKEFRSRDPVIAVKIDVDLFECQQNRKYFR
jgi:hypothetical protein